MATQIDINDPRTAKALEILTGAGQWLRCRTRSGEKRYGIPSQRVAGLYYLTDAHNCTCPDAQRHPGQDCKHSLAVALWISTVRAHHSALVSHRPGLRAA